MSPKSRLRRCTLSQVRRSFPVYAPLVAPLVIIITIHKMLKYNISRMISLAKQSSIMRSRNLQLTTTLQTASVYLSRTTRMYQKQCGKSIPVTSGGKVPLLDAQKSTFPLFDGHVPLFWDSQIAFFIRFSASNLGMSHCLTEMPLVLIGWHLCERNRTVGTSSIKGTPIASIQGQ